MRIPAALAALVAVLLALVPAGAGPASADEGGRRWVSTGTPVTGGGKEGDGPELLPGIYQDRFRQAPDTHWYVIRRVPGTMLFLSASLSVPAAEDQALEVEVTTRSGNRCAHGPNRNPTPMGPHPDTLAFGANRMVTTVVAVQPANPGTQLEDNGECATEDTLYLRVLREKGAGPADMELQYLQQPLPEENQDLPQPAPPEDEVRTVPPAATSAPVSGGGAFSTAPAIGPGSWTDEIRPGEQVFYRLRIDYGQSAAVTVDAPVDGQRIEPNADGTPDALSVSAYAPTRARVHEGASGNLDGDERHLSTRFQQVELLNMTSAETAFNGVPGYHYVVLQLDRGTRSTGTTPVKVRINVAVEGQVHPTPTWKKAPSTPTMTQLLDAAPQTTRYSSPMPWLLGTLGTATLAGLLAGAVAWLWGRG